ncbi:MAG: DUF3795 domain-containing protein [Gemmatimonadetes bacterium]|nr:DUF3795 domain-containing protein [Gemmatimonadota bacterium]
MNGSKPRRPDQLGSAMVAPCGLNCGVCRLTFRDPTGCSGCTNDGPKPKYCSTCKIRNCEPIRSGGVRFCFECPQYPCAPLRRLDKRYRTRYRMSVLDNLEFIRDHGMEEFIELEKQSWTCRACDALVCVHKEDCLYCGRAHGRGLV